MITRLPLFLIKNFKNHVKHMVTAIKTRVCFFDNMITKVSHTTWGARGTKVSDLLLVERAVPVQRLSLSLVKMQFSLLRTSKNLISEGFC